MAEPDAPLFVPSDRPRSERVPLDWPLSHDGRVFDAITVRRLTVLEVRAFAAAVEADPAASRLPVFVDDTGEPIPPAILDGLDADDEERLDEVVARFLPRRFRAALEFGRGSETGGGSAPT